MEEKLLQSAKLESLGVLAGGIAHDFNNLLTGVLANADLLLLDVGEGSTTRSHAQAICKAAERAAELAQQMLAYSGRGTFSVEPVNLGQFVRQTALLIQASIPKNVTLEFQLAEDVPLIDADLSQLQQLVMNIVINGAEAIGPEGGSVTIAAKSLAVDQLYCRSLALGEIRNLDDTPLWRLRIRGAAWIKRLWRESSILSLRRSSSEGGSVWQPSSGS